MKRLRKILFIFLHFLIKIKVKIKGNDNAATENICPKRERKPDSAGISMTQLNDIRWLIILAAELDTKSRMPDRITGAFLVKTKEM